MMPAQSSEGSLVFRDHEDLAPAAEVAAGAWHSPIIVGRWCRPIRKMLHCGRAGKTVAGFGGGGLCAGTCGCAQGLGLGGGCGSHCQGGLSPGKTLFASLLPVGGACGCGVCACGPTPIFVGGGGGDDHADHDHEPFDGVRGSCAAHGLDLPVATELLAAAALQKLTQLLHVEVVLPKPDVLGLHRHWPGLCLLAHKRTGKRMMTLQTNHSRG